jgi:hypothetical protein
LDLAGGAESIKVRAEKRKRRHNARMAGAGCVGGTGQTALGVGGTDTSTLGFRSAGASALGLGSAGTSVAGFIVSNVAISLSRLVCYPIEAGLRFSETGMRHHDLPAVYEFLKVHR